MLSGWTEALLRWDERIFLGVNGWIVPWLTPIFKGATWLGYQYFAVPITLIVMVILDGKDYRRKILPILFTPVVVDLFVQTLKLAIGRSRPYDFFSADVAQGLHTIQYLLPLHGPNSFPSGHAAFNFALAATLNALYPGKVRWMYGFAAVVAFSRIYVGAHFPLDVLAGSLIGIAGSRICMRMIEKVIPPRREPLSQNPC